MKVDDLVLLEIYHLQQYAEELSPLEVIRQYPLFFGCETTEETLRVSISHLADSGFILDADDSIKMTSEGRERAHQCNLDYYFSEGRVRSAICEADQTYIRRQHEESGIIGLTDEPQRQSIREALGVNRRSGIDIGCGDGTLTDYFRRQTGIPLIGIDSSSQAIERARQLYSGPFLVHDMNQLNTMEGTFDVALAIDSLYFSRSLECTLRRAMEKLNTGGILVATYSATVRTQEQLSDLRPENTPLAIALSTEGLSFQALDFGDSEAKIWSTKVALLTELRVRYEEERQAYLYWDRSNEARGRLRRWEHGLASRFQYVVSKG